MGTSRDDLTARCRDALLKACRVTDTIIDADREGVPIEDVCVDVDDAAAAMARAIELLRRDCERRLDPIIGTTRAKRRSRELVDAALAAARGEDR